MKWFLLIGVTTVMGCDPAMLGKENASNLHEIDALVLAPLCILLCNNSVDNIGETNAAGVDNFTGQTSTRTTTQSNEKAD